MTRHYIQLLINLTVFLVAFVITRSIIWNNSSKSKPSNQAQNLSHSSKEVNETAKLSDAHLTNFQHTFSEYQALLDMDRIIEELVRLPIGSQIAYLRGVNSGFLRNELSQELIMYLAHDKPEAAFQLYNGISSALDETGVISVSPFWKLFADQNSEEASKFLNTAIISPIERHQATAYIVEQHPEAAQTVLAGIHDTTSKSYITKSLFESFAKVGVGIEHISKRLGSAGCSNNDINNSIVESQKFDFKTKIAYASTLRGSPDTDKMMTQLANTVPVSLKVDELNSLIDQMPSQDAHLKMVTKWVVNPSKSKTERLMDIHKISNEHLREHAEQVLLNYYEQVK